MADTPTGSATLKTYFETGDVPTQQQFADWLTSYSNLVDNNALDLADVAITAHAGGGQGAAYQITKRVNQLTTVATAGDSVVLPAAQVGCEGYIYNAQSNSADVFPLGTNYFVNGSPSIAASLPGGYIIYFKCVLAGQWLLQYVSNTGQAISIADSAVTATTLTPIMSLSQTYRILSLNANLTINAPTFKFGDGQILTIAIRDDGTRRTLTWNAIYRGLKTAIPTSTSNTAIAYYTFMYNAGGVKWDLINLVQDNIFVVPKYLWIQKVSQTGTGAPTNLNIQNTLPLTPTWARSSTGVYTLTGTGLFDTGKVYISIAASDNNAQLATASVTSSPNVITVETIDTIGVHHDGYLTSRLMRIEVYE